MKKIGYEESSGNVFADLGLENADELFARGQIGIHIFKIIKAKNMKEREVAALLGGQTTRNVAFNERTFSPFYH